jgi:hypothetical protein
MLLHNQQVDVQNRNFPLRHSSIFRCFMPLFRSFISRLSHVNSPKFLTTLHSSSRLFSTESQCWGSNLHRARCLVEKLSS